MHAQSPSETSRNVTRYNTYLPTQQAAFTVAPLAPAAHRTPAPNPFLKLTSLFFQIERERRAKEQDLVKDMEMEIDRLQTIKMYKDREAELKHKLVEDRKVIEQQIARRAKEREAHKEAIRAEQAERKLQMQRQAEQEKEELAIE